MALDILRGFADTSGKDSTATDKVLTVNGCLSTPEKWQDFDNEWQSFLESQGFKPNTETGRYVFHTSPFWAGNCKFMPDKLTKRDKQRIYWHLLDLVRTHIEYLFGYGILLDDFRKFEKDYPYAREVFFNQPGTYASRLCFTWNSVWADQHGFNSSIGYTFDQGDEFWGELFDDYRKKRNKTADPDNLTVTDLSPGDKVRHSPLQAADIIAWEARKHFLRLSKGHLSGLISPPRPRPEMNQLGELGKNELRLYGYKDFVSELRGSLEEVLKQRDTLNMFIGEGKEFRDIDDLGRAILAMGKEKSDQEKKLLRDAWLAKKKARPSRF